MAGTGASVVMLVACLTSCWAADQASARKAVDTYLPDAATPLKEGLVASISALPEGGTLNITALGRTVSFHVLFGQVIGKEGTMAEQPAVAALDAAVSPWKLTPSALGWGADDSPYPGKSIVGPDRGTYVWVPAGELNMGAPSAQAPGEWRPQHRVRIGRGFWIGKFEVTNEQYRAFCQATERPFPAENTNGPQHPITCIQWDDAKAYCTRYGLALPTEAQWEWAASGPAGRRYPWGDAWDADNCCNTENRGPGRIATLEVGSLPTGNSWCGACDMAGNVAEWCYDLYGPSYYSISPVDDPEGPSAGDTRVNRGGHCRMPYEWGFECVCRGAAPPSGGWRSDDVGFRCAIVPQ